MERGGFYPFAERADGGVSLHILFPFATFENFCAAKWVGREREWFELFNVLHWTASYVNHDPSTRILLLQPGAPDLDQNLRAHLEDAQIAAIPQSDEAASVEVLVDAVAGQLPQSLDLIFVRGAFSSGATRREENQLLQACRRALKDGCPLLATFPLQDPLGNPQTARNLQFLDAATTAGFEQAEITGCDGLAAYLEAEFWDKLRKQGRAAFDVMLNAFATVSDDPSTLWMSRTAFYAGIKR